MNRPTSILWFRGTDLRLADSTSVQHAVRSGGAVVPVYIHDPEAAGPWAPGANARAWLESSLAELGRDLRTRGSRLILRTGAAEHVLRDLVRETGASQLVFARRWEPWAREQEARVGVAMESVAQTVAVPANLMLEPGSLLTGKSTPYRVFTPFWKRWQRESFPIRGLSPAPKSILGPSMWPASTPLDTVLGQGVHTLADRPDVLHDWTPGEAGALDRLTTFARLGLSEYGTGRDRPDYDGTSRLSPHLSFGEVSAERAVHVALSTAEDQGSREDVDTFIRQLAWREFATHVLADQPTLPTLPVRAGFERFPWRNDPAALDAWQHGGTGFPLIDAGMNQLLATGWMHNRVRMLVASFLTKDLLIPWQDGQRWFWDNLVDADLASNAFGWQWVAGCGHDASPYFRIFNPTTQGLRFDPDGTYVRRWVPELAHVGGASIHSPLAAPHEGPNADVEGAAPYPLPMVDHGEMRLRALAAYESVKRG